MSSLSCLKALILSIGVPHGADGDQLGPGHDGGENHVGPEHHKKVEMKFKWFKNSFPVLFKRKNCLPDAPDGDLDEVGHGAYVVAAPAISTLSIKIMINYVLVDHF